MAPHSRTLAWKIPWTEGPGRLQSMGSLRVRHDWASSLSCIGEGNGNLLQYSCLENPRDGGAWWAAVYGVAQSWTQLKWLSSNQGRSFGPWLSGCPVSESVNERERKACLRSSIGQPPSPYCSHECGIRCRLMSITWSCICSRMFEFGAAFHISHTCPWNHNWERDLHYFVLHNSHLVISLKYCYKEKKET